MIHQGSTLYLKRYKVLNKETQGQRGDLTALPRQQNTSPYSRCDPIRSSLPARASSRRCELVPKQLLPKRAEPPAPRGSPPLDVLAALHLWFVLRRLHLDGHHVVARRHVVLSTVGHLLLRHNAVDFCEKRSMRACESEDGSHGET